MLDEYVFVIDDEPEIVEMMTPFIGDLKLRVKGFSCASDLLSALPAITPFIIISDLQMPEMNGLELCLQVRRQISEVTFALCSGFVDRDAAIKGMESGVNKVFDKPVNQEELAAYILEVALKRQKTLQDEKEELEMLRTTFVEEAREHLNIVNDGILKIESADYTKNTLHGIFRSIHTIKGAAPSVGLTDIRKLAHVGEEVFAGIRDEKIEPVDQVLQPLYAMCDALDLLINDAAASKPQGQRDDVITPILEQLVLILEEYSIKTTAAKDLATLKRDVPKAVDEPTNIEKTSPKAAQSADAEQKGTIKVKQEKIESYMNFASELMISRNMLGHIISSFEKGQASSKDIREAFSRVDRITSNIQENALSLRMVEVKYVFQRIPRMVRDIAKTLSKKINVTLGGVDTEIDRQVADALSDPMIHLIRNAADHGVETPAERRKNGKDEMGQIALDAKRDGGIILITIQDDGAGIDTQRLKSKAVEKGIVNEEAANGMSEDELKQLVFAPGLSTAKATTDISGRGVGMDVVRMAIQNLGGNVRVHSELGVGTKFQIELPLTLAITRVIALKICGQVMVMPMESVLQIVKIEVSKLKTMGDCYGYLYRSSVIALVQLDQLLHLSNDHKSELDKDGDIITVLVISSGQQVFGVIIDDVIGQQEIVIKPLPSGLKDTPGFSGVTIDGDGSVILLLEPSRLYEMALDREGFAAQSA